MRRVFLLACCLSSSLPSPAAAAAVRVVATIFPLADMVEQIGKQHVEVITLLPAGASPHTFEPTPAQMRAMAGASVFFRVGAGLDAWASKLLAARNGPITTITVADGLPLLAGVEGQAGDPHIWLDPIIVRDHIVPAIATALRQAIPEAGADIAVADEAFCSALTHLDSDIRTRLAGITNRTYVATHAAWRYFGRRYALQEVAVVEAFPGKESSAQGIATVIRRARASHTRVLLVEPQVAQRTAQQIARDLNARLVTVDPLGGPELAGRNHYSDLMRYNTDRLAAAMQ